MQVWSRAQVDMNLGKRCSQLVCQPSVGQRLSDGGTWVPAESGPLSVHVYSVSVAGLFRLPRLSGPGWGECVPYQEVSLPVDTPTLTPGLAFPCYFALSRIECSSLGIWRQNWALVDLFKSRSRFWTPRRFRSQVQKAGPEVVHETVCS